MGSLWKVYKFSDAPITIIDGDRGKNYPKQNEFMESGYCLFLNTSNVTQEGFSFYALQFITKEKDNLLRSGKLCREDVVMTTRGTIGNVAYYNNRIQFDNMRINSGMVIFRCEKNKILPHFLFLYLRSPTFRAQINAFKSGVAQPQLPICDIRSMPIPILSYSEQKKVSNILSVYDDLTENNNRRIKILEEMAQTIYNEWFVKFRFPGNEKIKMVKSELDEIPEGWKFVLVKDVIERISAGNKYDNNTALPKGRVPILDQGRSGVIGYHNNEPDVIASEEKPMIVFANHTCYQRLVMFSFSSIQNVLPFMSSSNNKRDIYWLHYATKDVVKFNDYKGHFPEFISKKVILPSENICSEFGHITKPLLQLKYKLEQKNAILQQTRDLLLPRLISGELDVEDLDIKVDN